MLTADQWHLFFALMRMVTWCEQWHNCDPPGFLLRYPLSEPEILRRTSEE